MLAWVSGPLRIWWIVTIVYAKLLLIISVIPWPASVSVGHLDKVVHLCEYLLFAWLLVQLIRASDLREREYYQLAWMYATSYGLLIELIQGILPWRSADVADAAVNAVGAALGIWLGGWWPMLHVKRHDTSS